jgi:hypothetical protein
MAGVGSRTRWSSSRCIDAGVTTVASRGTSVCVDDEVLIEGVAGRLSASLLDGETWALLSATP